jgi:signal transduction histidine kinase
VPLLKILINQMAIALDNVKLFDEGKRQKYRIVHEREEERKRISDMLHDVLGAKLGMMKRNAEHAETLVGTHPDEAIRLMQQQQDDLQQMAIVTRNLSYELLPPTIRLGLDEALQAYIGQIQGIKIDCSLSKLPRLSLAVKTAAYYIAVQALENVQNHAGARKCRLELWIEEKSNSLCLQIEDDGKGLPNNLRWGVGLVSMYERTSELNGELLIRNRADQSGTLVLATLPLHYAN